MSDANQRPNILFISFDDAVAYWAYKNVFGVPLETPNLDRICGVSTAFHRAYCQAPVCGPSRASLMTGKTPHQLGVFSNAVSVLDHADPEDFFSFHLKNAGYFCSSGGKVHHGYRPLPSPVHEALYSDEKKVFWMDRKLPSRIPQAEYGGRFGGLVTTDPKNDTYFYDKQSADSAIDFIESYDRDGPFYREVGFFGPHIPHITPARYKDMYDPAAFVRPPSWEAGDDPNPFAERKVKRNFLSGDLLHWQKSARNLFAAISHVDHHLGRVWDALKRSRHAENTVVVIFSDHGYHVGEKQRFTKKSLWEQVARVPVIIHAPGDSEPREVMQSVALVDLAPTALDYAGLDPLPGRIGQSLRPIVSGEPAPERAVPTVLFGSAGVTKGDRRIIRYRDGSTELFDLADDWWQLRNLGQQHDAFQGMYDALQDSCRTYGLDLPDSDAVALHQEDSGAQALPATSA